MALGKPEVRGTRSYVRECDARVPGSFQAEGRQPRCPSPIQSIRAKLKGTVVIKSAKSSGEKSYRVYGVVRDQFQKTLAGVRVDVFDQDIRSRQPLGTERTGAQATYEGRYGRKQFARTDKDSADIVVCVSESKDKLLKESETHFNAPASLRVDIDLSQRTYAGPSEMERVVATVRDFIGTLPFGELTEDSSHQDISFLEKKTELGRETLETLAIAFRLAQVAKTEPVVLYGLLRQGPTGH